MRRTLFALAVGAVLAAPAPASAATATVEIRRVARALRVSDTVLRLWLELAVEAQLIGVERARLLPARTGDTWLDSPPGARLAAPLLP